MNCAKCGTTVEEGESYEHGGMTYCEDCYLDIVSKPKTCDPWAVHSAKSLERHGGGNPPLTDRQEKLMKILGETGGLEPAALADRLSITGDDLEREVAALRHMERVRGELREGRKFICLW